MDIQNGSHKSAWDVMYYLLRHGWYPDEEGGIINHPPGEWLCRSCGFVGSSKGFYKRWLCHECQRERVRVSREHALLGTFSHV